MIFGSSGKIHSTEAKLVCKPLFGELSPALSSAYGRREFLWKSFGPLHLWLFTKSLGKCLGFYNLMVLEQSTSSPLCMEDSPSIVSPTMGRAAKPAWATPGTAQGFLNPHCKEEELGGHRAQNRAADPKGLWPTTHIVEQLNK